MSSYKNCPQGRVLVVFYKTNQVNKTPLKWIHKGGTFVWPLIQDCTYLKLTPMNFYEEIAAARSLENIPVNISSHFVIRISTDNKLLGNAAHCLLNKSLDTIKKKTSNIINEQIHFTVATMTMDEIYSKNNFQKKIRSNVESALNRIGLHVTDLSIISVSDDGNYQSAVKSPYNNDFSKFYEEKPFFSEP
ncbi:MAG: flotillin family protein [Succinivibrionaceae bacterium]|nr:flotillin family protein [Succinivibrionaceae bacterium]